MDIEGRGECVSNPGDRRDGAGEAKEAGMFIADAVGEDLSCSFDCAFERSGCCLGDGEVADGCDL